MACYRLEGGEKSWNGRLLPTLNRAISRINVRHMLSHDGFGFSWNDPHASAGGSALIQTDDLRWGDDAGGICAKPKRGSLDFARAFLVRRGVCSL